jgi:hypothetical protein
MEEAVKERLNSRQVNEVQVLDRGADLVTDVNWATGKPEACGLGGVDSNFAVVGCGRRNQPTANLAQLLRSHRSGRTKPATGRGERASHDRLSGGGSVA